jgi:stress responsive alpha/beta barrel protein
MASLSEVLSMIISAQRIRFKDDVDPAARAAAIAAFAALAQAEPVEFAVFGQDLGDPADGFTHGFCVGLTDLDALDRYFADPLHAAADRALLPLLQRAEGLGISDDTDAELREKVVTLHQQRIARDPEYRNLLDAIPETRMIDEGRP